MSVYDLVPGSPPPLTDIAWPDGTAWPPQITRPASMDNLAKFGPAIASVDVDMAVIATLKEWLPTYLRFIARSRALDYELEPPRGQSYANALTRDEFKDYPLPGVFVVTAHTATGQPPTVAGDGSYSVEWQVATSAIVRGRNAAETRTLASFYELAVRMVLVEKGDLLGFADKTRWTSGGEARPLADPNGQGRYLGEGASTFSVWTDNAVQEVVGPIQPDQEPYADLARVESVDIDIEGAGINPTQGDDSE